MINDPNEIDGEIVITGSSGFIPAEPVEDDESEENASE